MNKKNLALLLLIFTIVFTGSLQTMAEDDGFSMQTSPMSDPVKVVKIDSTEYSSLKEAVNSAKVGDTITVIVPELTLSEYTNIPGSKKLTLDLNGNKMIFATDNPGYANINVSAGGSFSIRNGKITAEDLNKDGKTSGGIDASNVDFYMDGVEAYNMTTNKSGGVLSINNDNYDPIVKITNSNFHNNEAAISGGAISIRNSNMGGYHGTYSILGCTFKDNLAVDKANAYGAAFGGAIHISTTGKIIIKDNEIIGNEAHSDNIYGSWANFKWSCGGGMYISSNVNAPAKADVTLEDNIISKNKAQLMGGGVYLELTKTKPKNDEIHINSGLFSENYCDYAGGGLDYSAHNQPVLQMENVIITGNKSHSGGGVWACPTSRVRSHSTLGAAIIENKLIKNPADKIYPHSGTDIRFEGSDTKIDRISENNNPDYNTVTVQDRTFLGKKVNWYADEPDALYEPGNPVLTPDRYTDRNTSFGLYGEIVAGKDWYEQHKKEAKVIFIGNEAGKRGGAISTNSDIDFGQPNMDVDLKVTKKWLDKRGTELKENIPESVNVKLVRNDAKGGKLDLETIELNAENHWMWSFENLPSKGYINGELVEFSYDVVELGIPKGFKSKIKKIKSKEQIGYEYLIENTKEEIPKTPKEKKKTVVKTGDESTLNYLVFSTLTLGGLIYLLSRRKSTEN